MNHLMQAYIDSLERTGARQSSRNEARRVYTRMDKWLNGREWSQETIEAYATHLSRSKLKPSTRNKLVNMLKTVFRHDSNVNGTTWRLAALPHFKEDRKPPRVLTRDEIARIWKACESSDVGRTIKALLLTGARHQEVMGLMATDITGQGVVIRAERAKNRNERTIPWLILEGCREVFQPPFAWSQGALQAICAASGCTFTPKDCRSTHVTYAWSSGAFQAHQVCAWAGHTLEVAQARYLGPLLWDVKGTTVAQWYGLVDLGNGHDSTPTQPS